MITMARAIEAFANAPELPIDEIQWVLDGWHTTGPQCRALLHDYVIGADFSEQTERALYTIIHLLGEQADTASFPDLCRFATDSERCDSVLGEYGVPAILPAVLISTFDGNQAALHQLVENPAVEETIRAEALLVLAYLARSRAFPETEMYEYLAALPDRLQPEEPNYVWFGWVRAVAVLGFAGLSGRVERVFQRGLVDPAIMAVADFWSDLREAQVEPQGMSCRAWDDIGPMGSTIEWLASSGDAEAETVTLNEPVRNPLRSVGRNDPCPCGSGKKYKKCCLAA